MDAVARAESESCCRGEKVGGRQWGKSCTIGRGQPPTAARQVLPRGADQVLRIPTRPGSCRPRPESHSTPEMGPASSSRRSQRQRRPVRDKTHNRHVFRCCASAPFNQPADLSGKSIGHFDTLQSDGGSDRTRGDGGDGAGRWMTCLLCCRPGSVSQSQCLVSTLPKSAKEAMTTSGGEDDESLGSRSLVWSSGPEEGGHCTFLTHGLWQEPRRLARGISNGNSCRRVP